MAADIKLLVRGDELLQIREWHLQIEWRLAASDHAPPVWRAGIGFVYVVHGFPSLNRRHVRAMFLSQEQTPRPVIGMNLFHRRAVANKRPAFIRPGKDRAHEIDHIRKSGSHAASGQTLRNDSRQNSRSRWADLSTPEPPRPAHQVRCAPHHANGSPRTRLACAHREGEEPDGCDPRATPPALQS